MAEHECGLLNGGLLHPKGKHFVVRVVGKNTLNR